MTQREMTPRELADKIAEVHALVPDMPRACATALLNFAPEIIRALRSQAGEIDRLAEGIILCIDASWRPNEARDWGRPELILGEYIGELRAEIDALKAEAIVRGSIKLDEAAKQALERERRGAEIDGLRSEAILRGIQIKNLMAENDRLKQTGDAEGNQIEQSIATLFPDEFPLFPPEQGGTEDYRCIGDEVPLSMVTMLCNRFRRLRAHRTAEIARLKDVVCWAEYWEAARKEERDAAVAVAERLHAEAKTIPVEGGE